MRAPSWLVVAIGVAVVTAAPSLVQADDPAAYVVIVNVKNPVTKLDKKTVADTFLKKRTRWSDDKAILPVDQSKKSAVRKRFSQDVLGRSITSVKTYWNQLVFSGRGVPPPEVDTDVDVVGYVVGHPGSIGYVAATTELKDVKVVQVK